MAEKLFKMLQFKSFLPHPRMHHTIYQDHRKDGICLPGGYKRNPEEDAAEEEALSYSATSSHNAGWSKKGWWVEHRLP
jgi:hypothetical protein